jgi:hypothetical protein
VARQQISKRHFPLARFDNPANERLRGVLQSLSLAEPPLHFRHRLIETNVNLRKDQIDCYEQRAKSARNIQRPELPFAHAVFVRRA